MIAPFKNTLLFPDASIPLAPSCICVSVDAFIIRSAVFSSITKPYKPFLLPAPDFRSCCIFMRYLKNIFIFYAFAQYIFGPVCIPYSWAAPAFRQGAQWSIHVVWVAFHPPPTHKFLQRLLYWMQVKICVVSPLRRGQRKFKKQRRCHYNEKTAHQFSAGGQHDAEPCARGGGGGRSSEPRISAEAIDSQKAARWCVEQGLMQADGASFKPSRHTFRLQVIKAWNDLQAMQKAG